MQLGEADFGKFGLRFLPSVDFSTFASVHFPLSKTYPSGHVFIEQSEDPGFIGLIRSEIAKLAHRNSYGPQTTIGLRSRGWWTCLSALTAQVDSLSTIAATDSTVSSLSIETSQLILDADPAIRDHSQRLSVVSRSWCINTSSCKAKTWRYGYRVSVQRLTIPHGTRPIYP
jgi:hypothetical protein